MSLVGNSSPKYFPRVGNIPVPRKVCNTVGNFVSGGKGVLPATVLNYPLNADNDVQRVGGTDPRIAPGTTDAVGNWFDGVSQYYNFDADSALTAVGGGAFSIAAWFNTNTDNGDTIDILTTSSGGIADGGFVLRFQGGKIDFEYEGTQHSTATGVNDGLWHFVVVTASGSAGTIKIYLDGVLVVEEVMIAYNFTDTTILKIGSNTNGLARLWIGGINNVSFWDVELTPSQADSIFVRYDYEILDSADIIGYYDPNDKNTITSSGTPDRISLLEDKSLSGINLEQTVLANRPISYQDDINGIYCLRANPALSEFLVNASFDMGTSGNVYIAFVYQHFSSDSNLDCYVSFNGDSGRDFIVICGSQPDFKGEFQLLNPFSSSGPGVSSNGPSIFEIVLDWDNSLVHTYVDGVLFNNSAYLTTKISGAGDFRILQKENPGPTTSPDGVIGDVVVSSDISEAHRENVRGQLAWRYGLQGSLPIGDTYKNNPPLG